MKIIEANEALLDEIFALEQASFSDPWSKRSFSEAISSGTMHVYAALTPEGHVCGFGCLGVVLDEGEILDIAVSEPYRQSGIGSCLLAHMLTKAAEKGASVVFLEVRASNNAARHLYQKYGFESIGLRKMYYSLPAEDAVIMKKILCAQPQSIE